MGPRVPLPSLAFNNFGKQKKDEAINFAELVGVLPDGKTVDFHKPIAIAPPATLLEAKLSPWWPFYKTAIQAEYDGHIESGTWRKIL